MKIDFARHMETFMFGVIGTVILTGFSILLGGLYFLLKNPKLFLCTLSALFFVYCVGWCILHYDEFRQELKSKNNKNLEEISYRQYGIPVLDSLSKFETKHRLSTIEFMAFVYRNQIPAGVDNLDYLEWISLVNSLPSITNETREEK